MYWERDFFWYQGVGYGSWREEDEKEEDGKEEDGMTVCWTGKLPLTSAPLLL